jgi:hypothetical protein
MKRTGYFSYIEEKLGVLAYRINAKGRLNILDLHNHSENFYADLLSIVFGWELKNMNIFKQNVEAIDLVDDKNKIVIQVSATNTKAKLESSLSKKIIGKYPGYTFKFVLISRESIDLVKDTFKNPHGINFNPKMDIFDNKSVLNCILSAAIDKQKEIYQLVQKELGGEVDVVKLDSNLAVVINILSKENLALSPDITISSFEIDKKIDHNLLIATRSIIQEYAKYYGHIDKQYSVFDAMGSNKSLSVLQSVHSSYVDLLVNSLNSNPDYIFLQVIEHLKEKVIKSANFEEIPVDELELCVKIIVVDAFIRCKIFVNPSSYNYVTT